jgi:hypothetical protein
MMETKKQDAVIYIDGYGREHDALVTAVNEREQGFVTLVYVDVNAPEPENVKKLFDIAHVSHASKQEPNPDLPSYDVNAWKQRGELHRALPADHPAFDHPFLLPKLDEAGNVIPIDRPKTVAEVQSHQDAMVKRMGIDASAKVDEFSQPKPMGLVSAGPDLDRVAAFLQSRGYQIKDCHTAAKFLDRLQPHEAAGFKAEFSAWCATYQAPEQPGLPSAEDLDADAEEQKIKAATAIANAESGAEVACAETVTVKSGDSVVNLVCGEPKSAHTPEAAKGDVGMDHAFVPGTFDVAPEPPPTPILINTPEPAAPQTSANAADTLKEEPTAEVPMPPAAPEGSVTVTAVEPETKTVTVENKSEGVKDAPAEEGQTD